MALTKFSNDFFDDVDDVFKNFSLLRNNLLDQFEKNKQDNNDNCSSVVHVPRMDVYQEDDNLIYLLDLPGFKKENVSITEEKNVVTVTGERKYEKEEHSNTYHRRECKRGRFTRSFELLEGSLPETLSASFENGTLKLTLKNVPQNKENKLRQININ